MHKLLIIMLLGASALEASSPLSKIAKSAASLSAQHRAPETFLSKTLRSANKIKDELRSLIIEGRTVRTKTYTARTQYGNKTTIEYCLRKSNTPYLPGLASHDALYNVSLTQCLKTGEIKTQFSEKSLKPGVEAPPLSDSEKQAIVDEIMPFINSEIKRSKKTQAPEKLL